MKRGGLIVLILFLVLLVLLLIGAIIYVVVTQKAPAALSRRVPITARGEPPQSRPPIGRSVRRSMVPATGEYRRLLHLANGVPETGGIVGAPLEELKIDALRGIDADDLCPFIHRQESHLLITTGGNRLVVCHEKRTARIVTINVPVTDVVLHTGEFYFLSDGHVYSSSVRNVAEMDQVTLQKVGGLEGVLALEAPHDQSCLLYTSPSPRDRS